MKILRSVTQRGFSVGTAGWFTVLRPNTWFAASHLRSGVRYPSGGHDGATWSGSAKAPSLLVKLRESDRGWLRPALAVLGAVAITSVLLWWICLPR